MAEQTEEKKPEEEKLRPAETKEENARKYKLFR